MSGKEIHTKETFQVLGMSCAVCALNVETTLGAQEGVYEAKVNFAGSTVLVDYNPRVITPGELQKAVEAAGYELVVENTEGYGSSGSFAAGRVSRVKTKDDRGYCFGDTRVRDWYVFYAYALW